MQISNGALDPDRVKKELLGLAKALHVAPGVLRPDDVVIDILGASSFAADDLLEIEVRLQKEFASIADKRLTVGEVVSSLASVEFGN